MWLVSKKTARVFIYVKWYSAAEVSNGYDCNAVMKVFIDANSLLESAYPCCAGF